MPDLLDPLRMALAKGGGSSSDFDLNADMVLLPGRKLRPAAVLIALEERAGRLDLILTKRSSRLKHHPGQIAFPGGKVDAVDADVTAAAVREAEEEIGLPNSVVDVIGHLPAHETVTGFTVTPVVARVTGPFTDKPEAGEVEEVFRVPFSHVIQPEQFVIEGRRWQGRLRRYYAVPYGPYYIWGATARILRGLAERMTDK